MAPEERTATASITSLARSAGSAASPIVGGVLLQGSLLVLGGFVMAHLGRIPSTGDTFAWHGLRVEVVDMDGQRVDKILIAPLPTRDGPP